MKNRKSITIKGEAYAVYRRAYEESRLMLATNGINSFPAFCLHLMAEGSRSLDKKQRNRQLEMLAIKEGTEK